MKSSNFSCEGLARETMYCCDRLSPVQFDSETKRGGISQSNRFIHWVKMEILLWLCS